MTPDLAELRRLADEATPGPWGWRDDELWPLHERSEIVHRDDAGRILGIDRPTILGAKYGTSDGVEVTDADAKFIAAARSAVPALCDEIDRLRGLLDRSETALAAALDPLDYAMQHETSINGARRIARALLAELRAAKGDRE